MRVQSSHFGVTRMPTNYLIQHSLRLQEFLGWLSNRFTNLPVHARAFGLQENKMAGSVGDTSSYILVGSQAVISPAITIVQLQLLLCLLYNKLV